MSVGNLIRVFLALTILVIVFLRPPGTMLVLGGDTITYELCAGGEIETVTVALGGDKQKKVDLGCDFFSAQNGALPFHTPMIITTDAEATRRVSMTAIHLWIERNTELFNAPRAPPFVS